MSRKAVYSMVLFFVLMGVLGVSINVHKVEAPYPIIFIRADGSIDPSTANITSLDNVTYTFTADINAEIRVERSHIVINGNGYTLNGSWSLMYGFNLTSVSNVTIKNVNIVEFGYAMWLEGASQCVISNNTCTDNEGCIWLVSSIGNTVSGNNVDMSFEAVALDSSSGNNITGNNMTESYYGVYVIDNSADNTISGNNITENHDGIYLDSSSSNTISRNNITDNYRGISLDVSSNNTISENNMTNNDYTGILLNYSSNNNTISVNTITNNEGGIYLEDSSNNTISGNTITNNDYTGIYLEYHSSNNTISENNITNNDAGIRFHDSSNNTISGNNITNNDYGIYFEKFSNNSTIYGNNITENNYYGIYLAESSNNKFYHNNFIGNTQQVNITSGYDNYWDDGVEGNYWSNYTGVDLNHDGVGDSWHEIGANNIDHYPLMGPFHSFNTTLGKHVNVISNSTIESFQYFESNSTIIIYVSNMTADQTHGFCRISIPYEVMSGPFNVTIDGANPTYWNYTIYDDGKNRWIYFEYEHTTRKILIIPEFPTFLILPLLMIATLLAVIVHRRKHSM